MTLEENLMKEAEEFIEGTVFVKSFHYDVSHDWYCIEVVKSLDENGSKPIADGWINVKPFIGMRVVNVMGSRQFLQEGESWPTC